MVGLRVMGSNTILPGNKANNYNLKIKYGPPLREMLIRLTLLIITTIIIPYTKRITYKTHSPKIIIQNTLSEAVIPPSTSIQHQQPRHMISYKLKNSLRVAIKMVLLC